MDSSTEMPVPDVAADNLYPALFQCFTIILCGYIAGRLNVVSSVESKGIATFVGTFALPSLIFLSLARLDFSTINWTFQLAIFIAKGVVFFAVMIVTLVVSKPANLGRAGMFSIFCTQSNDFALGFPIINAVYENTHPEYALYLYLLAPISLAILNPVAFVLMEIHKQRENSPGIQNSGRKSEISKVKMLKQILKGIANNQVLVMTLLGILGNIIFKHHLSIYIEGLLQVFGNAFSAAALFLLGLRMVGQFHRLKGPALLLPCVLIMVKLIVLPVVMRETVLFLDAGVNETETAALSTYAFLYGTIPTAPAVFVFSNLYQLEIDLVASSMVVCTFLSGPIMFISAKMISIKNTDYADELKKFGFDLSIVALIAVLWVLLVFIVTKKYKRLPHKLTLCLITSQLLLSISVIWGGTVDISDPTWQEAIQQSFRVFSMFSCLLWTSMLSVGLLLLQTRGAGFVESVWGVLALVAWGAPAATVLALGLALRPPRTISDTTCDTIRLCLLVFCLTVTASSLILYIRFRRRSNQIVTLSNEVASSSSPNESSGLIDNAEPISDSVNVSALDLEDPGSYGAIQTESPSPNKASNGCCSKDAECQNVLMASPDIEDIVDTERDFPCQAAAPREHHPSGNQLLLHTVLIVSYTLCMFIGVTYITWRLMMKTESGIFIEIEFLDIAANYGQGLVMFILFGLNPEEILLPTIRYIKMKWHGADTVVLPAIEDLSFETKHVCDQFITHHLERCKEAIAKDMRWCMRPRSGVFRGACLARWLRACGLARDAAEARLYGRHLLDGRVIAHINNAYHFHDSALLYVFK